MVGTNLATSNVETPETRELAVTCDGVDWYNRGMAAIRECQQCGDALGTARTDARYCSGRCRQRARRARGATAQPPKVMRDIDRWVGWTEARRGAKSAKLPVCPSTGRVADVSDPGTWGSYREALGCAGGRVGFVLTEDDDVSCIDLDDVLTEAGEPLPRVLELIAGTPDVFSVEVSPSSRGLHVWHHGPVGPGTRRIEDGLKVERYSRGRYVTWTGRVPAWCKEFLTEV